MTPPVASCRQSSCTDSRPGSGADGITPMISCHDGPSRPSTDPSEALHRLPACGGGKRQQQDLRTGLIHERSGAAAPLVPAARAADVSTAAVSARIFLPCLIVFLS